MAGQERLREAAKAQLRRMMAVHKKKTGLNVDQWLRDQWQKTDQSKMAQILMDCNWDKEIMFGVFCIPSFLPAC